MARVSWRWLAPILFVALPGSLSAQNVNMGTTYNGLQLLASRIETRFKDDCVAVTRRDGTNLTTEARLGNPEPEPAPVRLGYSPQTKRLMFIDAESSPSELTIPPEFDPSMDWLNAQACSLLQDRTVATSTQRAQIPAWKDGLFRHKAAESSSRSLKQMSDSISRVSADFATVTVVTVTFARGSATPAAGAPVWESVVTSKASGENVGWVRWSDEKKALAFSYPGLTRDAVITEKNVGRPFSFDPNPAWGTTQAFAFLHFLQIKQQQLARGRRPPAVLAASMTEPSSVGGQDPPNGCDYLWYFEVLFRPCCDMHDRCYYYLQCNASTWYAWEFVTFGAGWWCTSCNLSVVMCFIDTFCPYLGGLTCI
jgi:hypothetical protein